MNLTPPLDPTILESAFGLCAAAYDFPNADTIIEIGGGQGALALEILSRHPDLHAISFDLPDVIMDVHIEMHPAHSRLELVGGTTSKASPPGRRYLSDFHSAAVF